MKKVILIIIAAIILIGGYYAYIYWALGNDSEGVPAVAVVTSDYKTIAYSIDGLTVELKDGLSEIEASPGSASTVTTKYFGNDFRTDLNNDGREDVVFLLTQETGGSGIFYYVVAALKTEEGYVGSHGYLLGDRIAPQTIELSSNPNHKDVVVVNYADRASGEPMTIVPSVGKSVYLKLDTTSLKWGTVEAHFEGEAEPSRMSLTMKDWAWVSASYNDERVVVPQKPGSFTLTFSKDGRFSAQTDCNNMSGSYTSDTSTISFKDIAMTKMFCENSQERDFLSLLEHASQYHFSSSGELILGLKFDSGTAIFK